MEFRMTRREMLAGLGLAGASLRFPYIAHGIEAAPSDSNAVKTKRIVWNELQFDVPASFEWNETGNCNGIQVDCPVYSGFDNGIAQVFFVKRWTVDDFSEDAWANLLTCDLSSWIDCVVTTDTMLLGFDYWDAKSYNNGGVRILAVFGKDHEYSDEKKVCAMATDGTSAWYICLFFTDNNDDDATLRAVDLILGSATFVEGEADSIDSAPLISYEKETLETQGLSIELPAGYQRVSSDENTWYGWLDDGMYYQLDVSVVSSKGADDWNIFNLFSDAETAEELVKTYAFNGAETSDIVVFGNKDYSNDDVSIVAVFLYRDSDPTTDIAALIVTGVEKAWVVYVMAESPDGDDEAAISLIDQVAGSITDKVETKQGKSFLLEKSKNKG